MVLLEFLGLGLLMFEVGVDEQMKKALTSSSRFLGRKKGLLMNLGWWWFIELRENEKC